MAQAKELTAKEKLQKNIKENETRAMVVNVIIILLVIGAFTSLSLIGGGIASIIILLLGHKITRFYMKEMDNDASALLQIEAFEQTLQKTLENSDRKIN